MWQHLSHYKLFKALHAVARGFENNTGMQGVSTPKTTLCDPSLSKGRKPLLHAAETGNPFITEGSTSTGHGGPGGGGGGTGRRTAA